jgi:hypothetical protein
MPSKKDDASSKSNPNASGGSSSAKPVRRSARSARSRRETGGDGFLRGAVEGLDPRQVIEQWIEFAQAKDYHLVAAQRKFDLDLDRVHTIIEEEQSLFEFCRAARMGLSEKLADLLGGPPTREGQEHRVFLHLKDDPPRVTKITLPGKYGRFEHTPFLYLERLALSNELFPLLEVKFSDCVKVNAGQYSIISSMRAFIGPHPSQDEINDFLVGHGFRKFSDGSITIDYTNPEVGLHLRDCHPKNWVRSPEGLLIPVDIVPERIV